MTDLVVVFHTDLDFTAVLRLVMRKYVVYFHTGLAPEEILVHPVYRDTVHNKTESNITYISFIQRVPCQTGSCILTPPGRRQSNGRNPRSIKIISHHYYQGSLEHLQGPFLCFPPGTRAPQHKA